MLVSVEETAMMEALSRRARHPVTFVVRDLISNAFREAFPDSVVVHFENNVYIWRKVGSDRVLYLPDSDTRWYGRVALADKDLDLYKVTHASSEFSTKTLMKMAEAIGLTMKS